MTKFIAIVCTAFFERVKPVSTIAKPSCMNMTRNALTSSHAKLSEWMSISMLLARSGPRVLLGGVPHLPVHDEKRGDHQNDGCGKHDVPGQAYSLDQGTIGVGGAISWNDAGRVLEIGEHFLSRRVSLAR